MSFGESIAPFFGRMVLAWFFLTQAYRYALDWENTVMLLSMKHVSAAPALLLVSLIGAVMGSMSLLLGFRTRAGALVLFAISIVVAVTLHDYWHLQAAVARDADFNLFARDIAIAGGLLMLIGMGSGRFGFDGDKPAGKGASKKEH